MSLRDEHGFTLVELLVVMAVSIVVLSATLLTFTTLSSTGLGDIVPVKPFARALVMFEMIAGVAYLTVVVSRLVALTVMRPEHLR